MFYDKKSKFIQNKSNSGAINGNEMVTWKCSHVFDLITDRTEYETRILANIIDDPVFWSRRSLLSSLVELSWFFEYGFSTPKFRLWNMMWCVDQNFQTNSVQNGPSFESQQMKNLISCLRLHCIALKFYDENYYFCVLMSQAVKHLVEKALENEIVWMNFLVVVHRGHS